MDTPTQENIQKAIATALWNVPSMQHVKIISVVIRDLTGQDFDVPGDAITAQVEAMKVDGYLKLVDLGNLPAGFMRERYRLSKIGRYEFSSPIRKMFAYLGHNWLPIAALIVSLLSVILALVSTAIAYYALVHGNK